MVRHRILHRTYYNFSAPVVLGPHTLRLRPREGHDLRIESSVLQIEPEARLHWFRDAEDNSVAIASFGNAATQQLAIVSEVCVQHYGGGQHATSRADAATARWPAAYLDSEREVLAPYMQASSTSASVESAFLRRASGGWDTAGHSIDESLTGLADHIRTTIGYGARMEAGVQTPDETLRRGWGACRDFAAVFVQGARRLGLAARYVSGYLRADASPDNLGATHAWAEVYVPGAGWRGFDPTNMGGVGADHIAVAVARDPDTVPPVSGSFSGLASPHLDVGVWVTRLAD